MQQSQSEKPLSRPDPIPPAQAVVWRHYIESAWAVLDVLEVEMREAVGIPLNWYDVLVQIEDVPEGLGMTAVAERILASKSGLTRVIDRMEEAGLVRRAAMPGDRRGVQVAITEEGVELLSRARPAHHASIRRHFLDHIDEKDLAVLTRALGSVCDHMRVLRPGRIGTAPAGRAKKNTT
jgi:DNA-binding MarR family transcriptional regulator